MGKDFGDKLGYFDGESSGDKVKIVKLTPQMFYENHKEELIDSIEGMKILQDLVNGEDLESIYERYLAFKENQYGRKD